MDPEPQWLGRFADGSRTSYSRFYPLAKPFPCPEGSWRKGALWPMLGFAGSNVLGTKDMVYAAQKKEKHETVLHASALYNFSRWDSKIHCWVHYRDTDTCCHNVRLRATFTHAQQQFNHEGTPNPV